MKRILSITLLIVSTIALFTNVPAQSADLERVPSGSINDVPCHFGMTVPYGSKDAAYYNLSLLGVDSYLDWGRTRDTSINPVIDYNPVLQVGDIAWGNNGIKLLSNIPGYVQQNPGAVWIIGNEPDSYRVDQDNVDPETYAQRYYLLATAIHNADPTAKVGFGSIIQPTPIRLRYLDRAWARLVILAGSDAGASSLIDIYTFHNFILNEVPGEWGAGVPLGFSSNDPDLVRITNMPDVYSTTIFQNRMIAMRQWVNSKGGQNKPLWLTEYGVLFPPSSTKYYHIPDEITRDFMLASFDFMMNHTDPNLGYANDANRLVQKWYWFSMDADRRYIGGSLFDPATHQRTMIVDAFINYDPVGPVVRPDLFPVGVQVYPRKYSNQFTTVDYRIEPTIRNGVNSDFRKSATISIYENNQLIGTSNATAARCGGDGMGSINWPNVNPGSCHTLRVVVQPADGSTDTNLVNNSADFTVCNLGLPLQIFIPKIAS